MAANYWVERMDRDQSLSYDKHKEDILNEELEHFMEVALGSKPNRGSWI